jgi:hypothetical protein
MDGWGGGGVLLDMRLFWKLFGIYVGSKGQIEGVRGRGASCI